jgi:glucuronosyltransferase
MAATFASLPCKVLWRLTPSEVPNEAALAQLRLGNNTKVLSTCLSWVWKLPPPTPSRQGQGEEMRLRVQVMTWVPQTDILAHPRTRAFVNHCGVNSMYEALWHGKPLLGLPFFGDQPSNADRVVAKVGACPACITVL